MAESGESSSPGGAIHAAVDPALRHTISTRHPPRRVGVIASDADMVRGCALQITPRDGYTVQTDHVCDLSTRQPVARVTSIWTRKEPLGNSKSGATWLEECISGWYTTRAVKELRQGAGPSFSRQWNDTVSNREDKDKYIARCFGWYGHAKTIWLATEYFPLGSLQMYLSGTFSEDATATITKQVLRGLRYLHQNNFAHQNLKPSNVLVAQTAPSWRVKISDFDLAAQAHSTSPAVAMTENQYLAPEALNYINIISPSERVNPLSFVSAKDIWAAGAIAYHLSIGRLPFLDTNELRLYVYEGTNILVADTTSYACIEFLANAMHPSPWNRLTADEALDQEWILSCSDTTPGEAAIYTGISHAHGRVSKMLEVEAQERRAVQIKEREALLRKEREESLALQHAAGQAELRRSIARDKAWTEEMSKHPNKGMSGKSLILADWKGLAGQPDPWRWSEMSGLSK